MFSSDPGPAANPACYGSDTGMNATANQVLLLSNIIRRFTHVDHSVVIQLSIVQVIPCDPEQFEGNVACVTMASQSLS